MGTVIEAEARTAMKPEEEGMLLAGIHSPADVRQIPKEKIHTLCGELRQTMTECVLRNGGHLASSLGAVELTVAIHRVFNAPDDHIIFDVGHQAYAHKLLTGRYDRFPTIRCPGGLSGFPKRSESPYDAFGVGHASTSLSAGLGFAVADNLAGKDCWTVVVMGDGALTGGMSYEALNNCGRHLHLILILNENEMSITRNVGHMAQHLTRLRMSRSYLRTKTALERTLERTPLIGKALYRILHGLKTRAKNFFYNSNYFESMGLFYIGPADGNNEETVEHLLRMAKEKNRSCVVHLKTVKGKGYPPAEADPAYYHGLAPADKRNAAPEKRQETFSETFGRTLTELAAKNEKICAITAAMRSGTGLDGFFRAYHDRAFDVGIAEEHAVTFAAGLSAAGYTPVVAIYSTFLQRAYDQMIHDVALQRLPMLICVDRAGLSAADGVTHHGIFDVAALLQLPEVELLAPLTTESLSAMLYHKLAPTPVAESTPVCAMPTAIRYPAGYNNQMIVDFLKGRNVYSPLPDVYVDFSVSSPPAVVMVGYGLYCVELLQARGQDSRIGMLMTERLAPQVDIVKLLVALIEKGVRSVLFAEEGIETGGFGMMMSAHIFDALQRNGVGSLPRMELLAIRNPFAEVHHGETVREAYGLGQRQIKQYLKSMI